VKIGHLDPMIDEKPENVGRQIDGEDNEVDPVVAVQQIDTDSRVVQSFTLRPQETCKYYKQ